MGEIHFIMSTLSKIRRSPETQKCSKGSNKLFIPKHPAKDPESSDEEELTLLTRQPTEMIAGKVYDVLEQKAAAPTQFRTETLNAEMLNNERLSVEAYRAMRQNHWKHQAKVEAVWFINAAKELKMNGVDSETLQKLAKIDNGPAKIEAYRAARHRQRQKMARAAGKVLARSATVCHDDQTDADDQTDDDSDWELNADELSWQNTDLSRQNTDASWELQC